jgi:hypothetical protein
MPGRKAKPPRLWFREDDGSWIILYRGRHIRTGCGRDDIEGAAKALEAYLGTSHTSTVGATDPRFLAIADVLTFYEQHKRPRVTDAHLDELHELLLIRLEDLNNFFGARKVSELKAQACRDFVDWSTAAPNENNKRAGVAPRVRTVSDQTARRRLMDLRAAINVYHAEHTLNVVPKITLPAKGEGRDRWLTRNEAARLLGAALGYVWVADRKAWRRRDDGTLFRRPRWIIDRRRPAARFILIGLYSARREETIRRTQWLASLTHPWFDLEAMIYRGRGRGERATKKRRPIAKISNRLRPHLLRWHRLDRDRSEALRTAGIVGENDAIRFVIHRTHDGQPLAGKIRSAWEGLLEDAALGADVVRHTLRHTAATWTMQRGTDIWQAAGCLGMTSSSYRRPTGTITRNFRTRPRTRSGDGGNNLFVDFRVKFAEQ